MDSKLLQQARAALKWPADDVLHTLKKFAGDREYLAALHHCEKMGRNRRKVMAEINRLRS